MYAGRQGELFLRKSSNLENTNKDEQFGIVPVADTTEQRFEKIENQLRDINDKLDNFLAWYFRNQSHPVHYKEEKEDEIPVYDILRELAHYLFKHNLEIDMRDYMLYTGDERLLKDDILEKISGYFRLLFPLVIREYYPSGANHMDGNGNRYKSYSVRFKSLQPKSLLRRDINCNDWQSCHISNESQNFWYHFPYFDTCKFVRENPDISFHHEGGTFSIGKIRKKEK